MRQKIISLLTACALVLAAILAASAVNAEPTTIDWWLSNSRVVSEGITAATGEGVLTTGYEIEAAANTPAGSQSPKGIFSVTVSIFSPNHDMPGQKAGMWYVQGSWNIKDPAPGAQPARRRDANVVRGTLSGELAFNPSKDAGHIDARVLLLRSASASRKMSGKGTFSGNEKFEGALSIIADRLPEILNGGTK
jgi:hypothetical protein